MTLIRAAFALFALTACVVMVSLGRRRNLSAMVRGLHRPRWQELRLHFL